MTEPDHVVTTTTLGAVRGVRRDGVTAFKGMPFAAPPFGPHRFAAPARAASWAGVRDATAFGPTPPRTGYPPWAESFFPDASIPGEDCLTVNVWTPDPGAGDLAVLVWIYGGAFRNGSTAEPLYDGAALAREGVVLVSCNYRTGSDGFLLLDGRPANRGLLDQVAALEWVQENVAAFGGDPGNVTLFGESAGAMSICSLLTMPRARGLFGRAILQSGAGQHAQPRTTAEQVTAWMADHLGVARTPEGFDAVALPALAAAQAALALDIVGSPDPARWGTLSTDIMPFEPTIDGDVLPVLPLAAVRAGAGADIPVLTGTTTEEWRFFVVPPGLIDQLGEDDVDRLLAAYGAAGTDVAAAYGAITCAGERYTAIATDWWLRIPAVRLAEARAGAPAPTHLYELAWRSPSLGGRLGACHALDLPFVFDTLGTDGGRAFAGDDPPEDLGPAMRRAWIAFAQTGDPGWPAYTTTARTVMRFDERSLLVDDPDRERRLAWEGIR